MPSYDKTTAKTDSYARWHRLGRLTWCVGIRRHKRRWIGVSYSARWMVWFIGCLGPTVAFHWESKNVIVMPIHLGRKP